MTHMSKEFLDAVTSALPELHEDDRGHLRDALEEWYSTQPGELPPVDAAIRELRQRLGLPVEDSPVVDKLVVDEPVAEEPAEDSPVVDEPVVEDSPVVDSPVVDEPVVVEPVVEEPVVDEPVVEDSPVVDSPVVDEPVAEEPAEDDPAVDEPAENEEPSFGALPTDEPPETVARVEPVEKPAPKRGFKFWRVGRSDPKALLIVGSGLVATGIAVSWWNASPAFTLEHVAVDSESIEVMWVDSDDPSQVVRCSPGVLEVQARMSAAGRTTIEGVSLPLLDDEWSADGSVARLSAEISPVGSAESFPVSGYDLGQSGNTEHDLSLVYRIDDCDQIEQMPSASALTIDYRFHGRDRASEVQLPERLAFIDEDCQPEDLEVGDCPS